MNARNISIAIGILSLGFAVYTYMQRNRGLSPENREKVEYALARNPVQTNLPVG